MLLRELEKTTGKWLLVLGLLGGLALGLFVVHGKMREEEETQVPAAPRAREEHVSLEEDETERYGLKTEATQAVRWVPRVSVYGRVVANPQASAEVRSPFAGTLRQLSGTSWPALGQRVRSGQRLGWVEVRVGPEIRLDLQNKLAEARIRQRGAEEEIRLLEDRVNSLKSVTSQQIISRVELDAALVQLAQARSQLTTARSAADLWQRSLGELERRKGGDRSAWSEPLIAPADGEVTDVTGRLGMAVEAGTVVLTLVDFRRPLLRLDLPPEVLALGAPPRQVEVRLPAAAVSPLGNGLGPSVSSQPCAALEAHLAGPAPRVDAISQLVGYWYDARLPEGDGPAGAAGREASLDALWRPGMQVLAEVRSEGAAAQPGVAVPARAVLYHEGRPLVYVRTSEEKFQRREVHLLGREGERWVVSPRQGDLPVGVTPGEAVVSTAAQVLLSKEFLRAAADED